MARIHAFALVAALLGGCASSEFKQLVDKVGADEVMMGVGAEISRGRLLQSVVSAYTSTDVDHLAFSLYKQQADSSYTLLASQDTPDGSGVAKTVNFAHLKMDTTYKVQVQCFLADGTDITKSGTGAATVTTSDDDYVQVSVSVGLADKTFDGLLHPVVSVSPGAVNNTSEAEAGSVADNQ